jgi:cbb3-type cytochrome oxidase subunit 3
LNSVVGGILLVAGLYSVLWAKNKESEGEAAAPSETNMTASCTLDDEEQNKPNKYELEEPTSSASAGEQV